MHPLIFRVSQGAPGVNLHFATAQVSIFSTHYNAIRCISPQYSFEIDGEIGDGLSGEFPESPVKRNAIWLQTEFHKRELETRKPARSEDLTGSPRSVRNNPENASRMTRTGVGLRHSLHFPIKQRSSSKKERAPMNFERCSGTTPLMQVDTFQRV